MDWKRSPNIVPRLGSFSFHDMFKDEQHHSYDVYLTQQSIYAYMLLSIYGIDVRRNMYLSVFDPDNRVNFGKLVHLPYHPELWQAIEKQFEGLRNGTIKLEIKPPKKVRAKENVSAIVKAPVRVQKRASSPPRVLSRTRTATSPQILVHSRQRIQASPPETKPSSKPISTSTARSTSYSTKTSKYFPQKSKADLAREANDHLFGV